MIKFAASDGSGTPLLGLGLSEENIHHLEEHKPIYIKSEVMKELVGWKGSLLIIYGRTEQEMLKILKEKGLIGPDTVCKEAHRNECDDIEDIHRTLEDSGVSDLTTDDSVNIEMAEHEGVPPKRVSFKRKTSHDNTKQ